jgi:putative transport protein
VVGIIVATIAVRYICRVSLEKEEEDLIRLEGDNAAVKPHKMHIEVTNAYLEGKTLMQVHAFLNRDFVCSRYLHDGHVTIPNRDTIFHIGDKVRVVCAEADAEAIVAFLGPEIDMDWKEQDQPMVSKRVIVTQPSINGKTLGQLHLSRMHGVNVTRVTRQGMDIFASPTLPLQVGDRVMVVGPEDAVNNVASMMGNSIRRLDAPNIATIFIGIIIGIIFGSLPIAIPGMPVPMKLGIAGGPLIIAILIGRYGYKIHLVTYTTTSANMMLREIGLVLFLASVGIKAGAGFWETVVQGDGLLFVLTGFLITVVPILIVGPIARLKYKFNYFTIMGMLAGTYTDPPALAYANSICSKEAPAVGYSTVYPLSMFLRILTAQIIVLFFCGV